MDIGFFFELGSILVQLPINPEKVTVKYGSKNETSEIIQLGEITLLKSKKLASISFESFLPYETWFPGIRTQNEFKRPVFYKNFFTTIQESRRTVRLIITGLDINMLCSIESFEYHHKAGDHEDMYFSIELKEYREYHVKQISLSGAKTTATTVESTSATTGITVTPSQITIGCDILLTGNLYKDSYKSGSGKSYTNYKGKVNLINKEGSCPYQITTPSGEWLGWAEEGSVKLA